MNNPDRFSQADSSFSPNFDLKASIIASLIPERGDLLDIGCYDARLTRAYAGRFQGSLYGMDFNLHEDAKSLFTEFKQGELDNKELPWPGARFDTVFAGEIIEHLYHTDRFVRELRRVLKPGGILVLTTPNLSSLLNRIMLLLGRQPVETEVSAENVSYGNPWNPKKPPSGHIRNFTCRALLEFLTAEGFKVLRLESIPVTKREPARSLESLAGKLSPRLGGDLIVKALRV